MKTNLAISLLLSSTQSIKLNNEENPLYESQMTPWEWKIFTNKERYDMYVASKNIVKWSNERIADYEEKAVVAEKHIKEQQAKLEETRKELKLMKDGHDKQAMKLMVQE
jgi:hypothetical protein